jgi:hypothetical protein
MSGVFEGTPVTESGFVLTINLTSERLSGETGKLFSSSSFFVLFGILLRRSLLRVSAHFSDNVRRPSSVSS